MAGAGVHLVLRQRISYEAQSFGCGIVQTIPGFCNKESTCTESDSTEAGWIVSFIVSLKIRRALKV